MLVACRSGAESWPAAMARGALDEVRQGGVELRVALDGVAVAGEHDALRAELRARARHRSRRTPGDARPTRRASGTVRRRARRAGSPPPTGRARPSAPWRPARGPAGAARAGSNVEPTAAGTAREGLRVVAVGRSRTARAHRPRTRRRRGRRARRASPAARSPSATHELRSRAAASREITPPYEWPTRWSPGSSRPATSSASASKSTRSTGGFGGNLAARGRRARTARRAVAALPRSRGRRRRCRGRARGAPSGDPRPCNELGPFSA